MRSDLIKSILGNTNGGPSISYEGEHYVLYTWTTSGTYGLIYAKTWTDFLRKLKEYKKEKEKLKKLKSR